MSSSIEQINIGCELKNVYCYINDIEIKANTIMDVNMYWSGEFSIYGDLLINDIQDIVNSTFLEPGNTITLGFTDIFGDTFIREFAILYSKETKEQNFKGIRLKFRDVVSHLLDKTYVPKGYTNIKLSDVFKDYLKLEVNDKINGFPLEVVIKDSFIEHEKFVVPLNMSFLKFIEAECKKEGVFFYQTKEKIHFGKVIEEPHKYDYIQATTTEMYAFRIIDYELLYNNINQTLKIPKTDFKVFDKDKKTMTHYDKTLSDWKDSFSLSEFVYDSQITNGMKHDTKEYLIDESELRLADMKNNTYLKIVVPGNVKYSELFRNKNIRLTGSYLTTTTRDDGDVRLSGIYQCFKIEDKMIAGNKFIQNLHLRRVSEGRK